MGYLVGVIGWMLAASNGCFFRVAESLWETKYRLDRGVLGAPKSCIFGSTETLLVTQILGVLIYFSVYHKFIATSPAIQIFSTEQNVEENEGGCLSFAY